MLLNFTEYLKKRIFFFNLLQQAYLLFFFKKKRAQIGGLLAGTFVFEDQQTQRGAFLCVNMSKTNLDSYFVALSSGFKNFTVFGTRMPLGVLEWLSPSGPYYAITSVNQTVYKRKRKRNVAPMHGVGCVCYSEYLELEQHHTYSDTFYHRSRYLRLSNRNLCTRLNK